MDIETAMQSVQGARNRPAKLSKLRKRTNTVQKTSVSRNLALESLKTFTPTAESSTKLADSKISPTQCAAKLRLSATRFRLTKSFETVLKQQIGLTFIIDAFRQIVLLQQHQLSSASAYDEHADKQLDILMNITHLLQETLKHNRHQHALLQDFTKLMSLLNEGSVILESLTEFFRKSQ